LAFLAGRVVFEIKSLGWLTVPAVLILAVPLINLAALGFVHRPEGENFGVFGGPEEIAAPSSGAFEEAAVFDLPAPETLWENDTVNYKEDVAGFLLVGGDSLADAAPIVNGIPSREGLITYIVQDGDNLSTIAVHFGVSIDTIYWANNLSSSVIKPGDELIILPINGVRYEIQEGDTIDGIAQKYHAKAADIIDFNKLGSVLRPGAVVIIPNGKMERRPAVVKSSSSLLPSYPGYFTMPTTGWNWGRLHNYNAVDIANSCGTFIYAAAEGLVVEAADSGWNRGYGRYIKIEHPNGTATLYAHTKSNTVKPGNYVQRGDLIAYIGNSGKTHGPTGCHLHFEVHGAKNPLVK